MPRPSDDLPRSPTGRIPQWVIDEGAGWAPAATDWRSADRSLISEPHQRRLRRRLRRFAVGALTTAVIGVTWFLAGAPGLPSSVRSSVNSIVASPPSAQVVALADAAQLSAAGRDLFYATHPQVLEAEQFMGRCDDALLGRALAPTAIVGCYAQDGDGTSIIVYAPTDSRLHGFVVETAAHETLHAAWDQLSVTDQAQMTPLLEQALASLPADDPIHEQITASVGQLPDHRPTEMFAYVGTQLWPDGGLDPQVEAVYARFITDRAALVAVHTEWRTTLDQLIATAQDAAQTVTDHETANAQQQAHYDATSDSLAYYRDALAAKTAEVDAMSADRRDRLLLSWVWWDGTELPMAPAAQTLADARTLLARDEADLQAESANLAAKVAAAEAERVQVGALIDDVNALQAQLDPATAS